MGAGNEEELECILGEIIFKGLGFGAGVRTLSCVIHVDNGSGSEADLYGSKINTHTPCTYYNAPSGIPTGHHRSQA
jgi:hypothetical protein